jgi:hypothetical protein
MKITDVSLFQVRGYWTGADFPPGDRQARPLDVYPEFNQPSPPGPQYGEVREIKAIYVELLTDEGISGIFGPIQEAQAFVIQKSLRPFLLGRDPLANEILLDQMIRLDRHGRSGLFMTGVSPVDCALWDLKGKAWGQPVWRLLGGPTREAVPAYASMLGFSVEPEAAAQVAKDIKKKASPPRNGSSAMGRAMARPARLRIWPWPRRFGRPWGRTMNSCLTPSWAGMYPTR